MVSDIPRLKNLLTPRSDRQDAHSAVASPKSCAAAVHNVAQGKSIRKREIVTDEAQLHVHVDDITGASFVCAPELVRGILPRFFGCFEKSTSEDPQCAIADPSQRCTRSIPSIILSGGACPLIPTTITTACSSRMSGSELPHSELDLY
jgi:hypothetical protein